MVCLGRLPSARRLPRARALSAASSSKDEAAYWATEPLLLAGAAAQLQLRARLQLRAQPQLLLLEEAARLAPSTARPNRSIAAATSSTRVKVLAFAFLQETFLRIPKAAGDALALLRTDS